MSPSFPLALKLEGRPCLVVGSTAEAAQRAAALLDCGAEVRVVARAPSAELRAGLAGASATLHEREYDAADMATAWLAVLTDRDVELAERMHVDAEAARVFFCAVDIPQYGSFAHVAVARAGLLKIGLSTEGQAPSLARRLREELQRVLDAAGLADFVTRVAELRRATAPAARKEVLAQAVAGVRFEGALHLPATQSNLGGPPMPETADSGR